MNLIEVADLGEEIGDAVGGGGEPGDEVGFEGAGDGGDSLNCFDHRRDEARVVEAESICDGRRRAVSVQDGRRPNRRDQPRKYLLHLLGDEADLGSNQGILSAVFPIERHRVERKDLVERRRGERRDIGLEALVGSALPGRSTVAQEHSAAALVVNCEGITAIWSDIPILAIRSAALSETELLVRSCINLECFFLASSSRCRRCLSD